MALGFNSQRPDKEFRKGPDNLWCISDNLYFMIECKNEILTTRKAINKKEAGQMNNHCGWFENEYKEANVKRFLVIYTKNLSYNADFTHDIKIIRRGKLREFKENIKSFIKEFKSCILNDIPIEKIEAFMTVHKLDIKSLEDLYCEDYYHEPN